MSDDEEAIGFCSGIYAGLVSFLRLNTSDDGVAEDLAQETLIRVVDRWPHVSSLDRPEAWAYRVATNLATSRWRRLVVEARVVASMAAQRPPSVPDSDDALALRAAVARLPPRQRLAVTLRFLSDLPVDDVASIMGCRPGTVQALTHQGVTALRREYVGDLEVQHG